MVPTACVSFHSTCTVQPGHVSILLTVTRKLSRTGPAAQVAAYIGDGMLVSEAAIRFHNCAAPLLASKAEHGLLRKALAACHLTLAQVKAEYAASIQVSDCAF